MSTIRTRLSLLLAGTSAVTALVLAIPAQAHTTAGEPYCGITWGSLPEARSAGDAEVLTNVRSGRHTCFDRLVLDLGGHNSTFNSYDVRYVPLVRTDGAGEAVPVRGDADLQVIVKAPAYDGNGHATFDPANDSEVVNVSGYTTFRQVAWAGSFEGQTTIALGVRARLPFRVFTLNATTTSGPRMVVDVAHRW